MDRELFEAPALQVAPQLLGALLTVDSDAGPVTVRITETEAYHGVGTPGPYDPGSHSKDRRTERNASMFGPPAHAYVYVSHGIHFALNMVCCPEGTAAGVLVRAGEVVEGIELARQRRLARRGMKASASGVPLLKDAHLARGPGNLAAALGITRPEHNGLDLFASPFGVQLPTGRAKHVARGPRVGVAGTAGGMEFPWRFWIPGEPSVSAFRPGRNAAPWRYDPARDAFGWFGA